jgi:hypothetical protein
MFHVKYFLYFISIHFILCTPQLNLYYTDGDDAFQHNCLRTVVTEDQDVNYREIMFYCMSELSFEFNIENNDLISKFTFSNLSKQNITSRELYLWSAPIDIIENYQFYLNQLSIENDLSLSNEIFYNCTMPRFGPKCQYQLSYHDSSHSSLYDIIYNFYYSDVFSQSTLTCYTHLKCNHDSSCLDWSEICDGEINCFDNGADEEHCWQLEINECKDNEYRCKNGQCIPQLFYKDDFIFADCIDQSDQQSSDVIGRQDYQLERQQLFKCDDIPCQLDSSTNFCLENRIETMHSNTNSSVSENCWSAFKCLLNFKISEYSFCNEFCGNDGCIKNVQNTCPDMIYFPNVPLLFGNVYLAFKKNDLQYGFYFNTTPRYICYNTSHYDELFINISKILFNNMTCVNYRPFSSGKIPWGSSIEESIISGVSQLYKLLKRYHLMFNYTFEICNRSNMYQCARSVKCISIYRLMDNIDDCPHRDDENIIEHLERTHFKCEGSGKYIPQSSINDNNCDCGYTEDGRCDDESIEINYLRRNTLFQHICDGFIDQLSIYFAIATIGCKTGKVTIRNGWLRKPSKKQGFRNNVKCINHKKQGFRIDF